jgi:hypothetical protein
MVTTHQIENISFDQNFIYLKIDQKDFKIALAQISTKLLAADDMQRTIYKISPSGYGIHWPLLDEDISVEALLKG